MVALSFLKYKKYINNLHIIGIHLGKYPPFWMINLEPVSSWQLLVNMTRSIILKRVGVRSRKDGNGSEKEKKNNRIGGMAGSSDIRVMY